LPEESLRRNDARDNERPAVRLQADAETDVKSKENADHARRSVHESGLLRSEA